MGVFICVLFFRNFLGVSAVFGVGFVLVMGGLVGVVVGYVEELRLLSYGFFFLVNGEFLSCFVVSVVRSSGVLEGFLGKFFFY